MNAHIEIEVTQFEAVKRRYRFLPSIVGEDSEHYHMMVGVYTCLKGLDVFQEEKQIYFKIKKSQIESRVSSDLIAFQFLKQRPFELTSPTDRVENKKTTAAVQSCVAYIYKHRCMDKGDTNVNKDTANS